MKTNYLYTLIASAALIMGVGTASAQKGRGDDIGLSQQGFQAEVHTVSGTLDHIKVGPCESTTGHAVIGTHFFVKTADGQLLNLHIGPEAFARAFAATLTPGDTVTAEVFQTDKLVTGEYLVKSVTANGTTLQARDDALRPAWAGDYRPGRKGSKAIKGQRQMNRRNVAP